MTEPIKSRRGVYYDLTQSPYEHTSPYGDLFKFSSAKRLEIFTRDVVKEIERVDKLITRNELNNFIPPEIVTLIKKAVYNGFYRKIERIEDGEKEA